MLQIVKKDDSRLKVPEGPVTVKDATSSGLSPVMNAQKRVSDPSEYSPNALNTGAG